MKRTRRLRMAAGVAGTSVRMLSAMDMRRDTNVPATAPARATRRQVTLASSAASRTASAPPNASDATNVADTNAKGETATSPAVTAAASDPPIDHAAATTVATYRAA